MPGASSFVHVPQETACELVNAADFFLSTSLLRPFFMAEWEAMACDVPMRLIGEPGKEFVPSSEPPVRRASAGLGPAVGEETLGAVPGREGDHMVAPC